jgi:hypothetical protein
MLNDVLLTIFAIIGIVLGLVYNKFVIKDYPDYKRKLGYFITIVVFLTFTLVLSVIISIKSGINSTIKEYSVKLEQYIKDNFIENEFVKNGLDLKEINNDISQINKTVDELKTILPTQKELGVDKMVYDLLVDYAIKELRKRLTVVNYSAKMINSFSDKNNVLTVSSITNGLRINATKLVNIVSLIIVVIFLIAFLIYIIYTLTIVRRERKFKKM